MAKLALVSLWRHRSPINLLGNHFNTHTGKWPYQSSTIGTNIDSFYEYLLKSSIYFNDDTYLNIFKVAYNAAKKKMKYGHWYMDVDMNSGNVVWASFNSLEAFWPGMQVMYGDVEEATLTAVKYFKVWRLFGFLPEYFDLIKLKPISGIIKVNTDSRS